MHFRINFSTAERLYAQPVQWKNVSFLIIYLIQNVNVLVVVSK